MVLINTRRIESIVKERIEECEDEFNAYEKSQIQLIEYRSMGATEDFLKDFVEQNTERKINLLTFKKNLLEMLNFINRLYEYYLSDSQFNNEYNNQIIDDTQLWKNMMLGNQTIQQLLEFN